MKRHETARHLVWDICEPDDQASRLERRLHAFLLGLILLNVAAVILESVPSLDASYGRFFNLFEFFSVAAFSLEYLARVWSCTSDPRYAHPLWGRLKFIVSPMALVDLIAIVPSYLFFIDSDLRIVRAFRLLRLARLGKLGRYSEASVVLMRVLRAKREEMIVTLSLVALLGVMFASMVYYAEHEAQPEAFPDIPHAMWWAFVTITTVGYGDIAPVTPLGKVIGICTAVLGILMIALPTGVLGAAFVDELNRKGKSNRSCCPHCGKQIDT
ncbi:MAG TPA: ion transporter [Kiritimatiellia bacterium]|nr:ion transporter [Kiritimatiellia bacterium]HMP97075.1 ion transporter [Kiritimatiellia bacterium]